MIIFWLLLLMSFAGTFYVMPHSMRKLRENGYVTRDMHKIDKPEIPTNAGIIIMFVSFVSMAILPLIIRILNSFTDSKYLSFSDPSVENLALLLVVSIYALYGLVDDLLDIGHAMKLILPITFGYPIIMVVNPEMIWIPLFGNFDLTNTAFLGFFWSDLFKITIIPIYIMVVSNLINMHSGFNGLQSGLSIILLSTILLESWLDGSLDSVIVGGAFLGSMLVLWWFNKYPSSIFEGNIGSLLIGSVIGCLLVIQQYWWFGFFILIPHIINFLLWIYWIIMIKINPNESLIVNGRHRKFGKLNSDNTIIPPNNLTLKWIPCNKFKLNENQATYMCYLFTFVFCFSGIIIF